MSVRVTDTGFEWPSVTGDYDTAFLELSVDSTTLGKLVGPALIVGSRGAEIRQYFERAVSGRRYVNVSSIARSSPSPGAVVSLKGNHLSWKSGSANLVLTKNEPLDDLRTLIVAPHPDDAEVAAFGLYGQNTWVVTVTAGEKDTWNYKDLIPDEEEHSLLKGRLRVWDSITVPFLGDVDPQRAMNLGYFDGTILEMYRDRGKVVTSYHTGIGSIETFRRHNLSNLVPETPSDVTWDALVLDLKTLLEEIRPGIIVTPHPLLDYHTDHQAVSIAVTEALRETDLRNGRLLLYTNHVFDSWMFPFGDRDGVISLPPSDIEGELFQQVISLPLTQAQQMSKLFAIEAMHDLRPAPLQSSKGFWEMIDSMIWRYLTDASYFRRAARRNELFFVIPYARAAEFFDEFETRIAP
jgi:LmbE family N-acetylglucosaminyl deacetylase